MLTGHLLSVTWEDCVLWLWPFLINFLNSFVKCNMWWPSFHCRIMTASWNSAAFSFSPKRISEASNVKTITDLCIICLHSTNIPVSILYKSIAGRYRPVRVADGPITARCRFIKNASWDVSKLCIKCRSVPKLSHKALSYVVGKFHIHRLIHTNFAIFCILYCSAFRILSY